jgi:hypothetical protein
MNPLRRCTPIEASRRGKTLKSDDGALVLRLAATGHGLYVERIEERPGAGRVMQSALFTEHSHFVRWCDADNRRFDYPLIYVSLRRDGDAVLRQR